MKILIFGPSGSGKTYIAEFWRRAGINAYDGDQLAGLFNWYTREGKKITEPVTPEEAQEKKYAYLWSKKYLVGFLARQSDVYLLGGSGNIASMFELLDRVYFLHVEPTKQKQRLLSTDRPTPYLDLDASGEPVIWGDWFEDLALREGIPFIDADQKPELIFLAVSH